MGPDHLQITSTALDERGNAAGGFRVVARGEVDVHTAPQLMAVLNGLIDDGVRLVVLDATDITFMDSSGLRVLVRVGHRMAEADGRLMIEGMSGAVQRVLEVSGILEQFRPTPP